MPKLTVNQVETTQIENSSGNLVLNASTDIRIPMNKNLIFENSNAKIYNEGVDGNLTAFAMNRMRLESNNANLELKANGYDITLDANRDVILKASDDEEYLKCAHSSGNTIFTKPVQLNGETTCDAQFNQNQNLHLASGKDLRLGAGGTCLMNRTGNDVNLTQNVVGGKLNLTGASVDVRSNGANTTIDATVDTILQASDGETFLTCSHSTGGITIAKETTCNAQFNQNEIFLLQSGKDLRLGAGGTCLMNRTGNDVNLTQNVVGGKLNLTGASVDVRSNGANTTIDATVDTILKASDGETFLTCSHSAGGITIAKETTCNAQFNQTENLHLTSGKDLRLGAGGTCKINRIGDDVNIIDSVVGGELNLEAPTIQIKGSTALNVVECPTIFTSPAVTNLADDGSIPITSTLVNIDANGSARTGIRFAGTGTVGQMIIVQNSGGEKLTFHNTEGTSLVKAIHPNHDTLEPASVYMFVSTGALWCIIGGGKGSGTQLVAS